MHSTSACPKIIRSFSGENDKIVKMNCSGGVSIENKSRISVRRKVGRT